MSAPAWFPWFAREFLMDPRVMVMDLEARGAYTTLLSAMWQADSCSLPDDDAAIARILGVGLRRWKLIRVRLVGDCPGDLVLWSEGGQIYNRKLSEVREEVAARTSRARAAANVRWDGAEGAAKGGKGAQSAASLRVSAMLGESAPGDDQGELVASIRLKGGEVHHVHQREVLRLKQLFPSRDVAQELRKMEAWCEANAKDRKTRAGVQRFISGWLSRQPLATNGSLFESGSKTPAGAPNGRDHGIAVDPATSRLGQVLGLAGADKTLLEVAR